MKRVLMCATFCLAPLAQAKSIDEPHFRQLLKQCAPLVETNTMSALVRIESGLNPYAIGVVGEKIKQPSSLEEAINTAYALQKAGKNFSLGLGQINIKNLSAYDHTIESIFEPCQNLQVASKILSQCYENAGEGVKGVEKALSCYYSGNYKTGFKQDLPGQPPYVERVKRAYKPVPALKPETRQQSAPWDAFGDWRH